jgi:hypothetical protein
MQNVERNFFSAGELQNLYAKRDEHDDFDGVM